MHVLASLLVLACFLQFDSQDDIDKQRDGLFQSLEAQLKQRHLVATVFTIRWNMV